MPPKKFGRDTEEGSDSLALEPLPPSLCGGAQGKREASPPPRPDQSTPVTKQRGEAPRGLRLLADLSQPPCLPHAPRQVPGQQGPGARRTWGAGRAPGRVATVPQDPVSSFSGGRSDHPKLV